MAGARPTRGRHALAWAAVAVGLLAVATVWVLLTDVRPSYDSFGWLVWGRQALDWDLNTSAAPSWKPLTFMFTLPYALAGAGPQMWLWILTATAAAVAGSVFAGRIAYRLTGPCPDRRWARWVAAAFAGVGLLGINGYSHLVMIANSDPMVVTLCLAAIDAHLHRRRRLAFSMIVLMALGRPEGWAFAILYAAWLWRTDRSSRALAAAGLLIIPIGWFLIPGLTSHSWFSAGDLALGSPNIIHGNKIIGVISRLRSLYPLPVQLAVLAALALAVVRRDRDWLMLAAAAVLWVLIEIGFAYHGWSATSRYLLEPGAVLIVLAGAGVGWVLAYRPDRAQSWVIRWAPAGLVLLLLIALAPTARSRARITHGEISEARLDKTVLSRLQAAVSADGGAAAIKRCGQPVAPLSYQSEVAWVLGVNVGSVGFRQRHAIAGDKPIVLLKPHDGDWEIRPYHSSVLCNFRR